MEAFQGSLVRSFSLGNAKGPHETDLPMLLRRLADEIEGRGITPMEFMDLVLHSEMTGDGPWWLITVYWSPDDPD